MITLVKLESGKKTKGKKKGLILLYLSDLQIYFPFNRLLFFFELLGLFWVGNELEKF